MTEILRVDQDEDGRCTAYLYGREFALASEPVFDTFHEYVRSSYPEICNEHIGSRHKLTLDLYELPPPPPKPEPRKWSRAMGLRKPKGTR